MASAYLLKRAAMIPLLLVVISFVSFLLVRAAPGGPFDRERKPASPEIERQLKAKYHLDEPLLKQYGRYFLGLLHGDLGPSLKQRNHSVNDIIRQALPISLQLGTCAFVFALGVGLPAGFFMAVRAGTFYEHWINLWVLLMVCVPALVLGPVLVMYFGVRWHWFPVALWGTPAHAVLPTITLGLYFAGKVARLMREGMSESLKAGFMTTGRAKGLSESQLILWHALKLGALPVISYSGPLLADLLTGSFVVENIFQVPGIGLFIVNSSLNRDYTLIVGLVILYAFLLLILNLVVDGVYAWIDPRIRLA